MHTFAEEPGEFKPLIGERGGYKINIDEMDGALNERCNAYLDAKHGVERTAALYEYVDLVWDIINVAGADPVHRTDVVTQARYIIDFNLQNRMKEPQLQDERKRLTEHHLEEFDIALTTSILDKQFGNSLRERNHFHTDITTAREALRSSFKKVITLHVPDRTLLQ